MHANPTTTIYHLEMCNPKAFAPKAESPDFEVSLVDPPNPKLNQQFYRNVGSPWQWTDRLPWQDADWHDYVHRDALRTWIGTWHGRPAGYFELESQDDGNIEIMYLGLLPDVIGQGLGGVLLSAAIQRAWQTPNTQRVWLHTCDHDHKHAFDNYLKRGFQLFKTEREYQ